MPRVNVYLPADLAESAKSAGLNISALTQSAIRSALAREQTDLWLSRLGQLGSSAVDRAAVVAAVHGAKTDLER